MKVYVVSGVLSYVNGEIYQDLTKAYARRRDALTDVRDRVRERLSGIAYAGENPRETEREAFARCVVDDVGNVYGWNIDEVVIE